MTQDDSKTQLTSAIPEAVNGDWFTRLTLASVFFLPMQIPLGGLFRLAPSDLLIMLALPFGIGRISVVRRSGLIGPALFPVAMLYGLLVSVFVADRLLVHAVVVKAIGSILLLVSLLCWQQVARESTASMYRLIRAFVLGSVVFTVIGMVEWAAGLSVVTERFIESRFAGAYFDPNHYGALTTVGLLLIFGLSGSRAGIDRTMGAAAIVLLAGLVLSASRGSWIAFVVGVGLMAFHRRPLRASARALVSLAVIAIGVLASGIVQRALDDISNRPDNVSHRAQLIESGLERLESGGFVGIGLSNFLEDNGIIIHNSLVWLTVELGIVGALLYGLFVAEPVLRLRALRLRQSADHLHSVTSALLGSHVVMVIASLNVEASFQRQWWFVLALIIGCTGLVVTDEVATESQRRLFRHQHDGTRRAGGIPISMTS